MIRHGSSQRVDRFNGVESIHLATRGSRTSSSGEASHVTDHLGVGQERVCVEGENDGRLIHPEHQIDIASGGRPQARQPVLVADRVVGRPSCLRIAGSEVGYEACERRRGEGLGEDRKAGTTIRDMGLSELCPGRDEIGPGLRFPFQPDGLRAVGIVQAEHRGLDTSARCPEGRGVSRVSLDLRGPPFVTLDDQAVRASAERHRRGVVTGNPGDAVLGSGDIGDDFFDGTPYASREPRERQRSAQEHHHLATSDPFGELRCSLRELTLEKGAGFGSSFELGETSPIFGRHRWHPEQSVGGLTGRSRSSCAASA